MLALELRIAAARARSPARPPRPRAAARQRRRWSNVRGVSEPTWSTPISPPSTISGTPSSDAMPFSRRIGLMTSAWSTSAMKIATRSAAIRPANPGRAESARRARPPPRCPWRRARRAVGRLASSSRIATVSTCERRLDADQQLVEQRLERQLGQRGIAEAVRRAGAARRRPPGGRRRPRGTPAPPRV